MSSTLSSPATASLTSQQGARFHLSLNVRDLTAAVDFFRLFFGIEPAKCRADYAKFELNDPPLVMSLEPYTATPGGNLNHLGFRVEDATALVELQRRLEIGGITTIREEGVECCYARQTKFWVHDPDGNMWEVYTLDEDIEHRGDGQLPVVEPKVDASESPGALWQHRLGQTFPQRLPILDATVDKVMLQGTFNERLTADEQTRRLGEIYRVLRPGGRIHLHMLTADRVFDDTNLRLPGPAAAVQAVPMDSQTLEALHSAGFVNAHYALRGASPCFRVGDAELRETRIEAGKA